MNESVLITRITYFLYLILLGILGRNIGFWLNVYKHYTGIKAFLLFLLLELLYNNHVLSKSLPDLDLSLGIKPLESSSKFSLENIKQVDPHPLKIIFNDPVKMPLSLPFLIMEGTYIETEVIWDELTDYELQLFEFDRDVNPKGKIN